MNTYVWTYTPDLGGLGVAVVVASTLDEARELLRENERGKDDLLNRWIDTEPEVIPPREVWTVAFLED